MDYNFGRVKREEVKSEKVRRMMKGVEKAK